MQKLTEVILLSNARRKQSRIMRIHLGADRAGDLAPRMVATAEAKKKAEGLPSAGQAKGPPSGREGGFLQHQAFPPQGGGGESGKKRREEEEKKRKSKRKRKRRQRKRKEGKSQKQKQEKQKKKK